MSQPSFHQGDHHFLGAVTFGGTAALPASSITDANVPAGANISALKLQQQRSCVGGRNGTVADEKCLIGKANGAGQIQSFKVCLEELANAGGATFTVDLKKDGVSVLTAPISITTQAVRTWVTGTLTGSVSHVANNNYRMEVVTTVGGGTLGKGLSWELLLLDSPV